MRPKRHDLMSRRQVANHFGLRSPDTVRIWERDGKIKSVELDGRFFYTREEVERFERERNA